MLTPISKGINNLLALATELERVSELYERNNYVVGYCQSIFHHPCGSPACAIGHWYALHGGRRPFLSDMTESEIDAFTSAENEEFGINDAEWEELFESDGCGGARTAIQAATYIRGFVARKVEALMPSELTGEVSGHGCSYISSENSFDTLSEAVDWAEPEIGKIVPGSGQPPIVRAEIMPIIQRRPWWKFWSGPVPSDDSQGEKR